MRLLAVTVSAVILASASAWAASSTDTLETSVVTQTVVFNGIRFDVPDAYRDSLDRAIYKAARPQPRVYDHPHPGGLGLEMVYPTLRPPVPEDHNDQGKGLTVKGVIDVNLESVTTTWLEYFIADRMRAHVARGRCPAPVKFMDRCLHWAETRLETLEKDEGLYLGEAYEFVFCSPVGAVEVPHCDMTFILIDGVSIRIRFDREFLPDVLKIREDIFDKVCSWAIFPADRDYLVNCCR